MQPCDPHSMSEEIMPEHVESVKRAWELIHKSAEAIREKSPERAVERDEIATGLLEAAAELKRLKALTAALPPDLGNIYDLPQELIDELSVAKTDELEDQLVTVINAYDGAASLDQILVGLYRRFKIVQKRRFIQNKLYRMDMIWSVDGKKGVYTTIKPDEDDQKTSEDAEEGYTEASKRIDLDDEIPF